MSIQPLQPTASSWAAPIAVGALVTFALHSVALLSPELWILGACCTCGLTGAPVGFVPAFLAKRADPSLVPGQGFAVSFIGTGLGALAVTFIALAVQGWELSPEELDQLRRWLEEASSELPQGERPSPEEFDELVTFAGLVSRFVPVVASLLVIIMGGLTGLITVSIMGRRAPQPPPA